MGGTGIQLNCVYSQVAISKVHLRYGERRKIQFYLEYEKLQFDMEAVSTSIPWNQHECSGPHPECSLASCYVMSAVTWKPNFLSG